MQRKQRFVADQRMDLPQIESLLNFIDQEFNGYNQAFLSPDNTVLRGWDVNDNGGLQIRIANTSDSFLFNSERPNKEGVNFRKIGEALLTLNLPNNATNFVEVQIVSETGGSDTVAIWDSTANGGEGEEITQLVDTCFDENPQLVSNTIAFSGASDKLPLAIVTTLGGVITSIVDARETLFHLVSDWNFGVVRSDIPISSLKDAYDAITTAIREIKGTTKWYDTPYTTAKTIKEYQNMFISGGGRLEWEGDQGANILGWSANLKIEIAGRTAIYTVLPGTATIVDGECLYVDIPDNNISSNITPVVAALSAVPISGGVVTGGYRIQVLFFRRGNKIYGLMDLPELDSGEVDYIGANFESTFVVAGETLPINTAVYISPGALDGGRTSGSAYKVDATNDARVRFLGFVVSSVIAGETVEVQTLGKMSDSWAPPYPYGTRLFIDPAIPGAVIDTETIVVGQWVIQAAMVTPSGIQINPAAFITEFKVAPAAAAAWPSISVDCELELDTQLVALAPLGGIILLSTAFTITTPKVIPSNIILIGRRHGTKLHLNPGSSLALQDNAEVRDIYFTTSKLSGELVNITNDRCLVDKCLFEVNSVNPVTCVKISGNSNFVFRTHFDGVIGGSAIGIHYAGGVGNSDEACTFM